MDASSWGFLGALVGTIVGALASILTTLVSSRSANDLQLSADVLARSERARAFQRDTLIELQEVMLAAIRLVHRAHSEDVKAARQSGEWGKSKLSEEIDQGIFQTNGKLAVLAERIGDGDLRSSLGDLRQTMTNCLLAKSEQESEHQMQQASEKMQLFMEKLGIVLRQNY